MKEIYERIARQNLGDKVTVCMFWGTQKGRKEDGTDCLSSTLITLMQFNKLYPAFTLQLPGSVGRPQSIIRVLLGILSTTLRLPGCESDHPLPSIAMVRNNKNFSMLLSVLQRQNLPLFFVYNWNRCFYTLRGLRSL